MVLFIGGQSFNSKVGCFLCADVPSSRNAESLNTPPLIFVFSLSRSQIAMERVAS
jgi:hypothetical protein